MHRKKEELEQQNQEKLLQLESLRKVRQEVHTEPQPSTSRGTAGNQDLNTNLNAKIDQNKTSVDSTYKTISIDEGSITSVLLSSLKQTVEMCFLMTRT